MNKKLEEIFSCKKSTHGETGHCWNGKYSHNQKCGCCDENVATLLQKAFTAGQAEQRHIMEDALSCSDHPNCYESTCLKCSEQILIEKSKEAEQKGMQEVVDYLRTYPQMKTLRYALVGIREKFGVK